VLPVSPAYADIYDRLMTVIETSQGRLGILIAVVDERRLREQIIQSYEQEARQSQIEPYRIELGRGGSLRSKLAELREAHPHLQEGGEAVITVTGAELLLRFNLRAEDDQKTPIEEFFGYLQWTREGMREFPYPIVLWLNHRLLKEISFKAPDFWSWRKGVFWFSEELDTNSNIFYDGSSNHDGSIVAGDTNQIIGRANSQDKFLPPLVELQQTIAELKATDPDSDNLATLYKRLGDIYRDRIQKGESPDPQQDAALGFRAFRQAINRYHTQQDYSAQATALLKLGNFLYYQSRFSEALEVFQELLAIARQTADRWNEGAALGSLGIAYNSLGRYEEAIDFLQQSLAIEREIGDRRGEGNSLGSLGNAYRNLGRYEEAIDFHQQALVISREIGDRNGEGTDLGGLGNAYNSLGRCEEAIDFYQQQLTIAREIGDRQGEGNALGNLGIVYNSLGRYEEAIDFHQQYLTIAREIGDRLGEGNALGNLGNAYNSLGRYEEAIDFHQQYLTIAREIGDRLGEGNALGNLGNAYNSLGRYEEAIDLFQQRLTIAREIGDRQGEGVALGNLGVAYNNLGRYKEAVDLYKQSLAIEQEVGDRYGTAITLKNLAGLHHALGAIDLARQYCQQALVLAIELGIPLAAECEALQLKLDQ